MRISVGASVVFVPTEPRTDPLPAGRVLLARITEALETTMRDLGYQPNRMDPDIWECSDSFSVEVGP